MACWQDSQRRRALVLGVERCWKKKVCYITRLPYPQATPTVHVKRVYSGNEVVLNSPGYFGATTYTVACHSQAVSDIATVAKNSLMISLVIQLDL